MYQTEAKVPASLKDFYTKNDAGHWILQDVEGLVPGERLDEFRNNNRALMTKTQELEAKLAQAPNAEEYAKIKGELDTLKNVGGENKTLTQQVAALTQQVQTLTNSYKQAQEDASQKQVLLEKKVLEDTIRLSAEKHGVPAAAMGDVVRRGEADWVMKESKPSTHVLSKDGVTPVTMDQWMENLATTAPHLFAPSGGGGAHNTSRNNVNRPTIRPEDVHTDLEAVAAGTKTARLY